MRVRGITALTLFALLGAAAPAAAAVDGSALESDVERQLIVRIEPRGKLGTALDAVRDAAGARSSVRGLGIGRLHVVRLARGADRGRALARLLRTPGVAAAEEDSVLSISAAVDDPEFPKQWGLENTGQAVGDRQSVAGIDVGATHAWKYATGKDVVIAVIDTGVQYTHKDLRSQMWANPGESGDGRETNRVDDDGNGYVDDVRGWDFAGKDNAPLDEHGHGTHVAGIAAAQAGNAIAGAGLAHKAKIMALRAGDASGRLLQSDVVAAYGYAAKMGARIINASFGGPFATDASEQALGSIPNLMVVASAGNSGEFGASSYPCQYDYKHVICVGSIDQAGEVSSFSSKGNFVDLAAPGDDIVSTWPGYNVLRTFRWEAGSLDGWEVISGQWAVAGGALNDSPGGNSQPGQAIVKMRETISLAGREACGITFRIRANIPPASERLYVEITKDGGASYSTVNSIRGSSGGRFTRLSGSFGRDFDNAGAVALRLVMSADSDTATGEGAEIDELEVRCADNSDTSETQMLDGTSMATPFVSAALALAIEQYPDASVDYLRNALLTTVRTDPKLDPYVATKGWLQAHAVLDREPPAPFALTGGTRSTRERSLTVGWDPTTDDRTGVRRFEVLLDGELATEAAADATQATISRGLDDGSHEIVVRAVDRAGNARSTSAQRVVVDATGPNVQSELTVTALRALAKRGKAVLALRADETADVSYVVRLRSQRGKRTLATLDGRNRLANGRRTGVWLRVTPRQRRSLARWLARGGLRAEIRLDATDELGNARAVSARASAKAAKRRR